MKCREFFKKHFHIISPTHKIYKSLYLLRYDLFSSALDIIALNLKKVNADLKILSEIEKNT